MTNEAKLQITCIFSDVLNLLSRGGREKLRITFTRKTGSIHTVTDVENTLMITKRERGGKG